MEDYTIVEKYQHHKQSSSIAVRPYFNPGKENMGLETYGLSFRSRELVPEVCGARLALWCQSFQALEACLPNAQPAGSSRSG